MINTQISLDRCDAIVESPIMRNELASVLSTQGIEVDKPLSLASAEMDDMDQTLVDIGEPESFAVRQIDEGGNVHTVLLSRNMTIELMGLMQSWVRLG